MPNKLRIGPLGPYECKLLVPNIFFNFNISKNVFHDSILYHSPNEYFPCLAIKAQTKTHESVDKLKNLFISNKKFRNKFIEKFNHNHTILTRDLQQLFKYLFRTEFIHQIAIIFLKYNTKTNTLKLYNKQNDKIKYLKSCNVYIIIYAKFAEYEYVNKTKKEVKTNIISELDFRKNPRLSNELIRLQLHKKRKQIWRMLHINSTYSKLNIKTKLKKIEINSLRFTEMPGRVSYKKMSYGTVPTIFFLYFIRFSQAKQ